MKYTQNMHKVTKFAFLLKVVKIFKNKVNFLTTGPTSYICTLVCKEVEAHNKTCKSYNFCALIIMFSAYYIAISVRVH